MKNTGPAILAWTTCAAPWRALRNPYVHLQSIFRRSTRELARRDVSEKVAGMNPEREIVGGRSELGSPRRSRQYEARTWSPGTAGSRWRWQGEPVRVSASNKLPPRITQPDPVHTRSVTRRHRVPPSTRHRLERLDPALGEVGRVDGTDRDSTKQGLGAQGRPGHVGVGKASRLRKGCRNESRTGNCRGQIGAGLAA
jgi:hypothetical protein